MWNGRLVPHLEQQSVTAHGVCMCVRVRVRACVRG